MRYVILIMLLFTSKANSQERKSLIDNNSLYKDAIVQYIIARSVPITDSIIALNSHKLYFDIPTQINDVKLVSMSYEQLFPLLRKESIKVLMLRPINIINSKIEISIGEYYAKRSKRRGLYVKGPDIIASYEYSATKGEWKFLEIKTIGY